MRAPRTALTRPRRRVAVPRPWLGPRARVLFVLALALLVPAFLLIDPLAVGWQRGLPVSMVQPFGDITHLGLSGTLLWPTGIAIILFALLSRLELGRAALATIAAIQTRLVLVFLAVGAPSLFTGIVKRLIGRLRPPAFDTEGHLMFTPFTWKWAANGFPSGHATTAFAAAVALGALWPQARLPLYALAALIALSRVVLGSHYPSDVIAGAILGAFGAALIVRAFAARCLAVKVTAAGEIRPMSGPSPRRLAALAGAIGVALRPGWPRRGKRADRGA